MATSHMQDSGKSDKSNQSDAFQTPSASSICSATTCIEPDVEGIPCGARITAVHPQRGLMAIIESPNIVQIYRAEDAVRFSKAGSHSSWQPADARDLPARTGMRSEVTSMEFSPDGGRLFVATSGRDALTTFEIDALGRIISQSCIPPATFRV